ncbi:MAG: 50S ribosomal protein L10 [Pseudomonadota bacterium]
MNRNDKEKMVEQLKDDFSKITAAVLADYRGTNVDLLTTLRRELRNEDINFKVIKNTLAKRAIKGTAAEVLDKELEGPIAIAYSFGDEIAPAKIISKFIKEHKNITFEIKAGYLAGKSLDKTEVDNLAKLPSKQELIGKLLYLIGYPISGFVGVLHNAGAQRLVYALEAIKKQKEG